ncbi:MAG TPA: hypothetical protein VFR02_02865, partial [bacterium]|nr:hypothetical protein [bacterium]
TWTSTFTPTLTPVPGVSFGAPQFTGTFDQNSGFGFSLPITITNSTATSVSYTATLPSGMSFSGFTATAGGTAAGQTLSWPTLGPGVYTVAFNGTIAPTATGYQAVNSTLFFTGGGPLNLAAGVTVVVPTATPTATVTPTSTPLILEPVTDPLPYPNPSTNTDPISVQVSFGQPTGPVHLEIFTTAFRKIQDINEGSVEARPYTWKIYVTDKNSIPLANGLYYLVVSSPNGRGIGKLLVLR